MARRASAAPIPFNNRDGLVRRARNKKIKKKETKGIGTHLDVFLLNPDAQASIGTTIKKKKMKRSRRCLREEVSLLNPAVQDPAVRLFPLSGY